MKAIDMFKDVESYNRLAPLMFHEGLKINLYDCVLHTTLASFESYKEFRRYIKKEFVEEVAKQILEYDNWTFDEEVKFKWSWSSDWSCGVVNEFVVYSLDLVRKY